MLGCWCVLVGGGRDEGTVVVVVVREETLRWR